jgi:hypothetical protein
VGLENTLVFAGKDGIWLVSDSDTVSKVSVASPPPEPSSKTRIAFSFTLDTDYGGTGQYSVSGDRFILYDNTSDPEPGIHRFLGSSNFANAPKYLRNITLELVAYQPVGSADPHTSSIWAYQDVDGNKTPVAEAYTYLPAPPPIGTHRINAVVRIYPDTGIRIGTIDRTEWRRQAVGYNSADARHYAITRVVGGVESPPTYFVVDPSNSGGSVNEWWFVQFGGMPSGTWRLYRRDPAGVYRMVHEGNTSSYTDYKADDELGDRLEVNEPPETADAAVLWNRRVVIAQANKIYLSEYGLFRFGEGAERIEVDKPIIGLAVMRGFLYYATEDGWYALAGQDGYYSTILVHDLPPVAGFVGDAIATIDGLVYQRGMPVDYRLKQPTKKVLHTTNRIYRHTTDNSLYIHYAETKRWTRLSATVYDYTVAQGVLWYLSADGLYSLSGTTRTAWSITDWILSATPIQLFQFLFLGQGNISISLTDTRNTIRSQSGALPLRLDRIDTKHHAIRYTISGVSESVMTMALVSGEGRLQLERE